MDHWTAIAQAGIDPRSSQVGREFVQDVSFVPRERPARPSTVFLYEHVSGGGLAGADLPESWAREGSAMRRALAADFAAVEGVSVVMTLDARLPDEPGPWTTVRLGPGEAPARLPAMASEADRALLIAPETGGILLDLARRIERAGARSLGCSPAAIELTGDKIRLALHLKRRSRWIDSPYPVRVRPREGLPKAKPYPAVLKPIDGAGSVDTLYVETPDDPIVGTFGPEFGLLQPFLRGEPRSATFLFGERHARLLGVARQEMTREAGRFVYRGGTILTETLDRVEHLSVREAIGAVAGLRGLVGVDYIAAPKTGRARVLEINPRPTTSVVGLIRALGAGRLASAWLDLSEDERAGVSLDFPPPAAPISFSADGTILDTRGASTRGDDR